MYNIYLIRLLQKNKANIDDVEKHMITDRSVEICLICVINLPDPLWRAGGRSIS